MTYDESRLAFDLEDKILKALASVEHHSKVADEASLEATAARKKARDVADLAERIGIGLDPRITDRVR